MQHLRHVDGLWGKHGGSIIVIYTVETLSTTAQVHPPCPRLIDTSAVGVCSDPAVTRSTQRRNNNAELTAFDRTCLVFASLASGLVILSSTG